MELHREAEATAEPAAPGDSAQKQFQVRIANLGQSCNLCSSWLQQPFLKSHPPLEGRRVPGWVRCFVFKAVKLRRCCRSVRASCIWYSRWCHVDIPFVAGQRTLFQRTVPRLLRLVVVGQVPS